MGDNPEGKPERIGVRGRPLVERMQQAHLKNQNKKRKTITYYPVLGSIVKQYYKITSNPNRFRNIA